MPTRVIIAPTTLLACLTCLAAGAAWPQAAQETNPAMFMYDAARTGIAPEPLAVPLALNWKHTAVEPGAQMGENYVASPAVDDTSVYFFLGRNMHAVSRRTGAAKWERPLELPDEVDSTPLVKDGLAVFGCRDGRVYFVDVTRTTGRIVGNFDLRRQREEFVIPGAPEQPTVRPRVQSSPLYYDGTAFFGGDDGWVYAVDLETQDKLWEFRTKGPVKASPSYWNHGIYVASQDGSVYGLNARTGRVRWETKLWRSDQEPKDVIASPVVHHSRVLAARGKFLYACDHGRHGYVRWRFEAKGNIIGTPAVSEGTVVFGDSAGKMYALSIGAEGDFAYYHLDSPHIIWQVPPESVEPAPAPSAEDVVVDGMDRPVRSSPTIVGDAVVYRAGMRQVNALSLTDGTLLWHYMLSEAAGDDTVVTPTETPTPGMPGMEAEMGMPTPQRRPGLPGLGMPTGPGDMGRQIGERLPPAGPSLVFEQEVFASPVAAGRDLYVLGNDGALYAFSDRAADAVPPLLEEAEIEVPARGDARHAEDLTLHKSLAEAEEGVGELEIRGALPIYIRLRAFDEGSGINPQSITVTQEKGGRNVRWEGAFDAAGGYVWALCEPGRGVARNLPDDEYVLAISVSDWRDNTARAWVAFTVDNSLAPPDPAPMPTRDPRMMPGMEDPGMYQPGMMPGMEAPGMPGMPGAPGAPRMPGMPGMP